MIKLLAVAAGVAAVKFVLVLCDSDYRNRLAAWQTQGLAALVRVNVVTALYIRGEATEEEVTAAEREWRAALSLTPP